MNPATLEDYIQEIFIPNKVFVRFIAYEYKFHTYTPRIDINIYGIAIRKMY